MSGHNETNPDKRQEGITRVLDYLRGRFQPASPMELYEDLEFEPLKSEVAKLVATATSAQRPELHFKLALLRSLRYSVASSKHCLVLGAAGSIRELYEGQRLLQQYKSE